jgi:hypothetical protein
LLWAEDLTIERRDRLLSHAAEWVVRKGLEAPAILFLEMHKPLTTLASVGYAFAQPPLMMFFGFKRTEEVRLLLSRRENVELLIDRIERQSEARRQAQKTVAGRRADAGATGEGLR